MRTSRVVLTLFTAMVLSAQPNPAVVEHPLEVLKSCVYWTVYEILRAAGRIDAEMRNNSVLLRAPSPRRMSAS